MHSPDRRSGVAPSVEPPSDREYALPLTAVQGFLNASTASIVVGMANKPADFGKSLQR